MKKNWQTGKTNKWKTYYISKLATTNNNKNKYCYWKNKLKMSTYWEPYSLKITKSSFIKYWRVVKGLFHKTKLFLSSLLAIHCFLWLDKELGSYCILNVLSNPPFVVRFSYDFLDFTDTSLLSDIFSLSNFSSLFTWKEKYLISILLLRTSKHCKETLTIHCN